MRPYRGKRKDNGEWVKGNYIYSGLHHYIAYEHSMFSENIQAGTCTVINLIEVLPESVGQSTGLKDKNGEEIFGSLWINGELTKGGDIVHIWSDFYKKDMPKAEVYWNEKNARFDIKEPNGLYHNYLPNVNHQGWFIEIIGTVHDKEKP